MTTLTNEAIEERLKHVIDPEIDLDIYSMGLVRDIVINGDRVLIVHTLTSPMCPAGPQIQGDIRKEILSLGASEVDVELTFDPPWDPPEELRSMLGI